MSEITCRVLLFAQLAERFGERELEFTLPAGATAGDAERTLWEGEADPVPTGIAIAINERYATRATALSDGDTVAFIPPVSGG